MRRRAFRAPSWLAAVLLLTACATVGSGRPADVLLARPALLAPAARRTIPAQPAATLTAATLDGRWTGAYTGRTYRRAGALEVTLRADGGALGGSLLIAGVPTADPARGVGDGRSTAPATRQLRVPLVRVALVGAEVQMDAEPYWDAGCGCTVTLQLTGRLVGDTLAGRFRGESAATSVPENAGRWRVVRSPAAAPTPPAAPAR